ncbi:mannonate dehydratase [Rhodobacteraceae bacterium N5(2021)]|uniref:Mannonate dehydratase n=1 Tax=Gymnodinialimonas phycosphaerae TaxID=2841589 RepID=A0A975TT74_9RHOB|nr:mannonate dehydratase [Gymnodinialimonas phycosphaerae]MBY4893652.1 mannonate dehydratase [Gymnodinialimonas phycosphaerae]
MRETWRWFGSLDALTLPEIAQTGAAGIVTALHEIPYGEVWSAEAIAARNAQITDAGFTWDVVESLPIHEAIKRGEGDLSGLFANYRQSMANLATNGVRTICYNFMPLLDWTRTDLAHPLPRGGTCLRFEAAKMAAFEVHMVKRAGAEDTYSAEVLAAARSWFEGATEAQHAELLAAVMSGLPGAYDRYDIRKLRSALRAYDGLSRADLRANLKRFLEEVIPTAQDLGMAMGIHPDDPPRDILGLPRIVSDADDIAWLLDAVDTPENGLTLCTGSLGANPANDLPNIVRRFGDRIPFAHLRNVAKDPDGSFQEAAHLEGDTDMVAVIDELLKAESRRDTVIPFRPDHGHDLLSDTGRQTHPGYPLIGRLRGLAELRGVIAARG